MISIIVCSIDIELRDRLKKNIEETIGYDFEFLYLDNRIEKKGICAAYNMLAEKAIGDYLCFVHEDVSFESRNWGVELAKQASDKSVGVLGFAGSGTMGSFPYWLDKYTNIHYFTQRTKDGAIVENFKLQEGDSDKKEVVVLDGMFLFCRKEIWEKYKFDEQSFSRFHLYDIDFTFNVSQSYKNYVNQTVLMTHYSLGSPNRTYYDSMILFHKKWKEKLPYTVYPDILAKKRKKFYHYALREFIRNIKKDSDISNKYIIHYLKETNYLNSLTRCIDAFRYIIKFSLKKKN